MFWPCSPSRLHRTARTVQSVSIAGSPVNPYELPWINSLSTHLDSLNLIMVILPSWAFQSDCWYSSNWWGFCRFSSDKLANVADFRMLMAVKNKHVFLCGAAVTHEPLVAACAVEISAEWKQPYWETWRVHLKMMDAFLNWSRLFSF